MALIRFYSTGSVWTIGEYDAIPAYSCARQIDLNGKIKIVSALPVGDYFGGAKDGVLALGFYSDFCGANGVAYASLAAFKAATDAFFTIPLQALDANGNAISPQRNIRTFLATITLGANQNAYAAGDIILDTGGVLGVWDMSAQPIKTSCTILGVRVQTTDATGLASKNLKFHIFNDAVTPIADNAAFAIADANYDKREGTVALTMGSGTTSKVGQSNYENLVLNPVAGKIYFILEDVDGHTPSANSTVIYAYIKVELGN